MVRIRQNHTNYKGLHSVVLFFISCKIILYLMKMLCHIKIDQGTHQRNNSKHKIKKQNKNYAGFFNAKTHNKLSCNFSSTHLPYYVRTFCSTYNIDVVLLCCVYVVGRYLVPTYRQYLKRLDSYVIFGPQTMMPQIYLHLYYYAHICYTK